MICYKYDDEGYFEGEEECLLDPLETELKKVPVWLLPAGATFNKPLEEKEGYRVKWSGNIWEYEAIPEPEPMPEPEPIDPNKEISAQRQYRFQTEADPIKYDYDEALARGQSNAEELKQKWLAKKDEIRADLPYVEV